jgi:phosphoribosyl 1,2-cyclic phosphodiesterase
MHIKFWGVRGSLAMPLEPKDVESKVRQAIEQFVKAHGNNLGSLPNFLQQNQSMVAGYGGNTSCAEVFTKTDRIIIDGGSGLKVLGEQLMKEEFGKGQGHIKILMTHFHWDHLVGLPFFSPLYIAGNVIDVYCPDSYVEEAFKMVFKKPFFPLPFEQLAAQINFHVLPPRKPVTIGEFTVAAYRLDHPDPCWGYKISSQGSTLSYAVDTEAHRRTPEELGEDLPLYQNSDLLVFDAQYTLDELKNKTNWGHSAAPIGLQMALDNNIPEVIFVHHDPASSDEDIDNARRDAEVRSKDLYKKSPAQTLRWHFAKEGEVVKVGKVA